MVLYSYTFSAFVISFVSFENKLGYYICRHKFQINYTAIYIRYAYRYTPNEIYVYTTQIKLPIPIKDT